LNPIVVTTAEPGFKAQFWKVIRTLGGMFILVSGVNALLETPGGAGGISRGLMGGSPEPQPAQLSNVTFKDVKGVDEAKSELEEIVAYLRNPGKFTKLGGKLPKGVLLVGPPGTGKTMLAKAIAGEAGVPFFYASGSDFEEMFVGVGARRVRDLFAAAKRHSPCIIFLDEVDAIGGKRNPKDQTYQRMTLNQLLVELDGFKANEGVIVIAATNFASSLDNALVRPGRFDRTVTVSNPDVLGREQILESHFKGVGRGPDVDLNVIARGTPGMSGADLANLVNVAALKAAQDDLPAVTMYTMEWAKDRIQMGAERRSAVIPDAEKRLTAYHEGGHAVVALHTPGANPVHKATVMPRGQALGFILQLPEKDELSLSRRQLQARLDVAMGGRVAEELIFGTEAVTTGASSDLSYATRLAQDMVTRWGFSEDKVGLSRHQYDDREMSPDTKKIVEEETKAMLAAAYERAKKILTEKGDELELLAKAMIEKETLTGAQINELLEAHRKARGSTA